MKNSIYLFTIISLLIFTFSKSSLASPEANLYRDKKPAFQSIDEIHDLVTQHVKQKIDQKIFEPTIQLRKLSPETRLKPCLGKIQIEDKNLDRVTGRMTISAVCLNPNWRVYVPVTVNGKQPVVISTKGILKKAVIKEEDVKQVLIHYKKIPSGSMVNISKAIGMRAKKSIAPNQILKIRDLQPPYWVFKNQQVNIITRIGEIEVKTTGTALKNAVVDEQVSIKNNSSKKTIKGIVVAPNTVLVP